MEEIITMESGLESNIKLGDGRFAPPLSYSDQFSTIELQSGNIVFSYLVEEARESACNSAKRIAKTSSGSYAEQIWALITSGKYRRGSLSYPQEAYDEIIESIETSINDSKPIELVFSFFPCKVRQPLKTMAKSGSEIDIGEIASLLRLYEICYGIMQIYEPGAKFNIMCDGFRYQDCFFDSDAAIHGY